MDEFRRQCARSLGCFPEQDLEQHQEFLDVKLPRLVSRCINADRVRVAIAGKMPRTFPTPDLPTISTANRRLKFGPEPKGAIQASESYLLQETSNETKETELKSGRFKNRTWVPVAMGVAMVASWRLPLSWWALILVSAIQLALFIWFIWPARDVGFSTIFRKTTTVVTTGIFGIVIFGIAYAVCALTTNDFNFGEAPKLGNPFLVSTGLGVCGGILGDSPTGAALVIAHIQLLLFLSGIAGIVATVLRIDRGTRQRG